MSKRISALILSATLISSFGCSQGRKSPQTAQQSRPAVVASTPVSQPQLTTPVRNPQPTTLTAAPSDRPAKPAQKPALVPGSAGGGYTNEVESANYSHAQYKTKAVPSYQRRGQARTALGPGYGDERPVAGGPEKTASHLYQVARTTPLSTFAADVDTASYANLRRTLATGGRPDPEAVRVEEMLNYFSYDLPEPAAGEPFSVTTELSDCPWKAEAQLLRVAIKTKSIEAAQRPPCNLVFLLDVSGSMSAPDKLPLLKSSLKTLVDNLDDADRIAIVTYAGNSGLALASTPASQKETILEAIDSLRPGGSTNGASGIELAYQVAKKSGTEGSVNRVILCTDGDFNVGVSSPEALRTLIEQKRKSGLFLSVLGFGTGNNDKVMETLADNGNGNYASIDSPLEARKVLVEEAGATLVTVAQDVKFQVAFNPQLVGRYRILGYENRMLAAQDFDNDAKDAGDLGAGHAVTVLYEIVPPKTPVSSPGSAFEKLQGGKPTADQLALVKLRYKQPGDDASQLREVPVKADVVALAEASNDQRWAVAVTGFGLRLHGDPVARQGSLDQIAALAEGAVGAKGDSYRLEFLKLVGAARKLPS